MTKALSSYPKSERTEIAKKRVYSKTGGLGYWASVDYLRKTGEKVEIKGEQK